jgi:hypothetical protein
MRMNLTDDGLRPWHPAAVIAGGVLLALGVAMLLTPAEDLRLDAGRLIGPFIMIAIGTTILAGGRACAARPAADEATRERRRAERRNRSTSGLWMIGIGCWLLVSQTHLFGLGFRTSWPLLLIVMGLLLTIRGWR